MKKFYFGIIFILNFLVGHSQNVSEYIINVSLCETAEIIATSPVATPFNTIITPCSTSPLTNTLDFYLVYIEAGSTFTFLVTPENNIDFDFASWKNPNLNNLGLPDRASQNNPFLSSSFATGLSLTATDLCEVPGGIGNPEPGVVRYYDVQAGDQILIALNRWSLGPSSYTISFGGDAVQMSCPLELNKCDLNQDGSETFNLTNEIVSELQLMFPEALIAIYNSEANAVQGTSEGLITGDYVVTSGTGSQLFARIVDANGIFIKVHDIILNVFAPPVVATPQYLYYCTNTNETIGLFDLTIVQESIDEELNWIYNYYTEESDAVSGSNANVISNLESYSSTETSIYVRVENEHHCYVVMEVFLIIIDQTHLEELNQSAILCLEDEQSSVDLTSYFNLFTNQPQNFIIHFYENEQDALANNITSQIEYPESYDIETGEHTFWIHFSQNNGINCQGDVVGKLTLHVNTTPDLELPETIAVCSGQSIIIHVNSSGEEILWFDTPLSETPIHTGLVYTTVFEEDTTLWIRAVNEFCESETKPLEIVVFPIPHIELNPVSARCSGESVQIIVQSDVEQVLWYDSATSDTPFFIGSTLSTPILYESVTYYVEAINDMGCISERAAVFVEIHPLPSIAFENEVLDVCEGDSVELNASSEDSNIIRWFENEPDTQWVSTGNSYELNDVRQTTSLWAQSFNPETNCYSEKKEILIQVHSITQSVLYFDYEAYECFGNQNILIPRTPPNFTEGGTFISNPPNLEVDLYTGIITLLPGLDGSYEITYTLPDEDFLCATQRVSTHTIEFNLCVPKGISPNGDGLNDYLDLSGLEISILNIYNRFGKKVFSQKDYNKEWAGQDVNGNLLPQGTYFYVIEKRNGEEVSGYIFLSREIK